MATTIKLKNGSGAPLAGDLVQGEPALDLTNKRLYTEDSGGSVIEVGTNPTSLTTGTFTSTGIDDNATSTAITIDASENVGIGTTPSAWRSSETVIQLQDAAFYSGSDYAAVGQNYYIPVSGGAIYEESNYASDYYQTGGQHVWRTAASGTAGTSIGWSEAMRIDSSGRLGIGTNSPDRELDLVNSSDNCVMSITSATGNIAGLVFGDTADDDVSGILHNNSGDYLYFNTSSTERMRIDASGQVGIGTSSPAEKLDIAGVASANGMKLGGNGTDINSTFLGLNSIIAFKCNDTEHMRLDSSGNVGIGTSSPNKSLEIASTSYTVGMRLQSNTSDPNYYTDFEHSGSSGFSINSYIFGQPTTSMTLKDGNVGIGTSSPFNNARLQVKTGTDLNLAVQTGTTLTSGMKINAFNDAASVNIPLELNGSELSLKTNEVERVRIDSSGNVGIGAAPAEKLHVDGGDMLLRSEYNAAGVTDSLIYLSARGGGTWRNSYIGASYNAIVFGTGGTGVTYSNAAERMRLDDSGNLLVGRTSVSGSGRAIEAERLSADCFIGARSSDDVYGRQAGYGATHIDTGVTANLAVFARGSGLASTYLNMSNNDGTTLNTYLYQNSNVLRISPTVSHIGTTSGTVVGTQTSDERLKDIEPTFEYGLSDVMALKPIAYKRNDEQSSKRQLGFGAQSTLSIVPEAVYDTGECIDGYDVDPNDPIMQTPKSDNTKMAMEYVQLIPVLTKAIQEQQAMIEELKAEVAALKGA